MKAIGQAIAGYFVGFVKGDWATKLSYIIMGFGCVSKKQPIKALLYFAVQVAYFLFMYIFGWQYISKFGTLGTVQGGMVPNADGIMIKQDGDDSRKVLLFSILVIVVTIVFLYIYISNTRMARKLEALKKEGKHIPTFKEDLSSLLDENYHVTLLTVPSLLVGIFTILPLIFMILIAFTNFDSSHQPPASLFTWVGVQNFANIFYDNVKYSTTFGNLLSWTLFWAVFATFSCYILGVIVALMINKKGIKFKGLFRTMFVLAIAVPSFITLLLMRTMLNDLGVVNVMLQQLGWISEPISFFSNPTTARATVLIVNLWIGIPYTILITSGILMNIPEELYESAKIDGAGPFTTFRKITLPYMLFVTTPYLITQFVGNINNFNVIYFLTGGGPDNPAYYNAGDTDLLVTWLYKLTVNKNDYSLAATIGILVFVICASLSLLTFNRSKSSKNEEEFS